MKIIAIGIGNGIDPDELSEIATDENHVVTLSGYKYLDDPINKLLKLTCVRSKCVLRYYYLFILR